LAEGLAEEAREEGRPGLGNLPHHAAADGVEEGGVELRRLMKLKELVTRLPLPGAGAAGFAGAEVRVYRFARARPLDVARDVGRKLRLDLFAVHSHVPF
jgi:hypothetical protein